MNKVIFILLIAIFTASSSWAGSPKAGDTAPGFSLESVSGEKHTLSELKGKVVLIGMFHICVPCMNQAMEFEKVREALGTDKLVVLGINTSGDSKNAVQDYLAGFPEPISFPYLLDPEHSVHKAYTQRDMPTVLIIDAEGILRARSPSVGADQLIPYLKKLL
ncbi:MAG: TlpA family protein disulfide reductase [Nitrospinota bacterium]|nr:TlpA family protein disulfide reductase [Nitrospinota bacterium]